MSLLFWGMTTSFIGKVFLVVGILKAHGQISHEHKIDQLVLRSFHTEKILTIIGLLLIIVGYAFEMYFYGFTPLHIHDCDTGDCAAAISTALSR